jgi:protein-tyrosine phosphatase
MIVEIYWIPGEFPGSIAIMPRPRGSDWLEDEVISLAAAGVQVLVSLLEPDEVRQLELEAEENLCRQNQLEFISFPIPDRGVPESQREVARLVDRLVGKLQGGRNVALHCRQGIGRSSLVAAAVLLSIGMAPDRIFRIIGEARGCPVPDTEQQIEYAFRFRL